MSGQAKPDVSIVIPAYNEERRIGRTLERICGFTPETCTIREILVVDDGSRDGTVALVERMAADGCRRIRLLSNGSNRGKGFTVRHGVLAAEGSAVLFSDADLSTPIAELDRLVPALARADVAIGSRALPDSVLEVHQPLYRELSGRAFNLFFQVAVLPGIHDSQCGFKLFRREAAREVFRRLTIDGFGFDIEVLYVARCLGYTIAEVGVRWVDDPDTKVTLWKDAPRMFADLVRVRWRHRGLTRP